MHIWGKLKGLRFEISMNTVLCKVSLVEVERWLDAVQEMLSNDATGLGKKDNLQEELNNCKVRGQPKKKIIVNVYFIAYIFANESKLLIYSSVFLLLLASRST